MKMCPTLTENNHMYYVMFTSYACLNVIVKWHSVKGHSNESENEKFGKIMKRETCHTLFDKASVLKLKHVWFIWYRRTGKYNNTVRTHSSYKKWPIKIKKNIKIKVADSVLLDNYTLKSYYIIKLLLY